MASTVPASGFGATVAWTTYTEMNSLQLTDLSWSGVSAGAIETTHYGTAAESTNEHGNATFIPSKVVDPGTFTFEYSFNPDTRMPSGVSDTITITWPSGGATWAFTGFTISAPGAFPMRERMTTTVTVKCASKISITDAA